MSRKNERFDKKVNDSDTDFDGINIVVFVLEVRYKNG